MELDAKLCQYVALKEKVKADLCLLKNVTSYPL